MLFDDIPRKAKPLETAILLLYDPLRRNQKEVRYLLHLQQMKTVWRVLRKFDSSIQKIRARHALLTVVPEK